MTDASTNQRSGSVFGQAIRGAYRRGEEDETLEPLVRVDRSGAPLGRFSGGDSVIFYDIRGEREIEITRSLTEPGFSHFPVVGDLGVDFVTLIEYDPDLRVRVAYPKEEKIKNTLAEVVSRAGFRTAKIAESEKATHIGFFMNGKNDAVFPGEERVIVPSPQTISNYDEKPEMSAGEVADVAQGITEAEQGLGVRAGAGLGVASGLLEGLRRLGGAMAVLEAHPDVVEGGFQLDVAGGVHDLGAGRRGANGGGALLVDRDEDAAEVVGEGHLPFEDGEGGQAILGDLHGELGAGGGGDGAGGADLKVARAHEPDEDLAHDDAQPGGRLVGAGLRWGNDDLRARAEEDAGAVDEDGGLGALEGLDVVTRVEETVRGRRDGVPDAPAGALNADGADVAHQSGAGRRALRPADRHRDQSSNDNSGPQPAEGLHRSHLAVGTGRPLPCWAGMRIVNIDPFPGSL